MAGNNIIWDGDTDGEPTTGANWSDGGEPDATDVAIIPAYSVTAGDATVDTILGSAAFPSATDVQSMIIEEGGSFTIGSRALPLTIKFADLATSDLDIGGVGVCFLTPVNYDTITVTEAGSAPGSGEYALNLTGMTHAAATAAGAIHVNCESNMSVGIGAENGVVTEVETIVVTGGDVTIGSGCVQLDGADSVDLTVRGGNVVSECNLGTVLVSGGTLTIRSGVVDTLLTIDGGRVNYESDGTCLACVGSDSGILDFSGDDSLRTFTTMDIYTGFTINDPNGTVTWTNGIDLNKARLGDVVVDIDQNINIVRTGL